MRFWLSMMAVPELDQLVELAKHAEECGFYGVTYADHLIMPTNIETPYPYTADGKLFWPLEAPWPDPWITLALLGAETSTIHLATNIYLAALRDPFTVAAQAGLQSRLICGVELAPTPVCISFVFNCIEIIRVQPAILPAINQPGQLACRPALFIKPLCGNQLSQQAQLIVGIDDGIIAFQTDQFGVAAQHFGADGVERAQPWHTFHRRADQIAHPLAHFAGGAVGESNAKNLARPGKPHSHKVCEASRQGRRFAGPGARQHQNRPFCGQNGFTLGRI